MKKLLPVFATLFLSFALSTAFAQTGLPYVADYSSDFKIGNPDYSKMVLDLWKDWDDNTFDKHDYFADTIKMFLADSMVVDGKAAALDGARQYRGGMSSAKSVVHAWVPLHTNNNNEDAVCIWGTETDTWPDGRMETRDIHEVWWFNTAGKVYQMRQWTAKFGR